MIGFQTKHGYMNVLSNDIVFASSLRNGKIYEEDIIFQHIIPKINDIQGEKIILDIGSHIGSHTLLYAKYIDNCIIHAFEPQKEIFNAVGHKMCNCNMSSHLYDGYNCNIEYNTNKILNYGGLQLGLHGEQVAMITIDSLQLSNCHYIKMDVEGAESLTLMGAIDTIKKFKPIIFFECTDKHVNDEMKQSLDIDFIPLTSIEILKNEGYTILDIDECNKLAFFQ
jgi:FkbM family methyltransferase